MYMKREKLIHTMLYVILFAIVCWLYFRLEDLNKDSELLEIKAKVRNLIHTDSLNTIKLQAQIIASDSIINTLNERNKKNESEIKRLKKSITIYDYTSSELPDL